MAAKIVAEVRFRRFMLESPRIEQETFRIATNLSADQVLERVRVNAPDTSRATVYNTLRLFREKNLVRELIVDPDRVVFDSNTDPHYHLYDVDTGEVRDVAADELTVVGVPHLPEGIELEQVDVIIRVRGKRG